MKIPDAPFSWKLLVGLSVGALAIWALYLVIAKAAFCTWQEAGVFGDTFGALSSLFSILAFAGVLFSLFQDRKERSKSARIEAYDALLRSIETQLSAAERSGADALAVGDLLAKQRLYSEELETLLTGKRAEPLLSDDALADAFARVPWFSRDDVFSNARGIRERLQRWTIVSPEDVDALVDRTDIRDAIAELYVKELKRDPKKPFDPDAFAVWGGMFFRQGLTPSVREHVRMALRKSSEWRTRNL
ncbi:hypothetical protein [Opitutus terrae]|uniref:Uncharacterized protein n=1 Tax=Opitutus terrae (strain DSM 11246 / JCM 15787 / PB90-1) TaxID=452637 RepID=B1ZZ13_OPITP|nr:hypothetical protein [Opitutus terrae]ACB76336.1 hypothetical protein Oter_3056 [Opitutus terrae PB90-1]